MGTCPAVRLGAAAVVGYALGSISGNATVAWLLAAAAVAAAYVWGRVGSRRSGASCGLGLRCGPSPADGQRSMPGSADAVPVAGPGPDAASGAIAGPDARARPGAIAGPVAGADTDDEPATLGDPARR